MFAAGSIAANGRSENQQTYNDRLKKEFPAMLEAVSEGEAESGEIKEQLKALRSRYGISYTDESGIIDSILDKAGEGRLSYEESEFYFNLLTEGRLMEYRKATRRHQEELHQKEIVALLQQEVSRSAGADELLNVLNNYYDFFGLEYNDDYFVLSRLIIAYRAGEIDTDSLNAEFDSMQDRIRLSEEIRNQENSNRPQSDVSSAQAAEKPAAAQPEVQESGQSGVTTGQGSSGQGSSGGSGIKR